MAGYSRGSLCDDLHGVCFCSTNVWNRALYKSVLEVKMTYLKAGLLTYAIVSLVLIAIWLIDEYFL